MAVQNAIRGKWLGALKFMVNATIQAPETSRISSIIAEGEVVY